MRPDEDVELAKDWHRYAAVDIEAALGCLSRPRADGLVIAFHCQQAVEKAYKGALALHGQEVARTHDLVKLEATLAKLGLVAPVEAALLEDLTRFAIDDKYPRMRAAPITRDEAAALIPAAQLAVDWLAGLLAA